MERPTSMTTPQRAPFGEWRSPITSDLIVADSIRLGAPTIDGEDIYWLEGRPIEGGRNVLVRRTPDGATSDVTPAGYNIRTLVHEYGGGAYLVVDGVVYFSNFADQRIYRQVIGEEPQPVTPNSGLRYADAVLDRARNRLICVCEEQVAVENEAINSIIAVALDGTGNITTLAKGNDFYSSPRLSPADRGLAYLTWNHPNLPWDGTELWVGDFQPDGTLAHEQLVSGGKNESIFQPEWSPEGIITFVSDTSNWWNLYRYRDGQFEYLASMAAEFGVPQWVFGMTTYAYRTANSIICTYTQDGIWHLASLDLNVPGSLKEIPTPYQSIGSIRVAGDRVVLGGGSPTASSELALLDLNTGTLTTLRRANNVTIDASYLSVAQPIAFPTENGLTAHAFFYPPRNPDFVAPEGEKPPLLVMSHGGPTSATSSTLDMEIQYWTTRGIGVLDVNYGGSTGYGREYRQRLNGQWGVVDVDDCINGAKYLVARGQADGERLLITGGSAGGYTTLAALTFRKVFRAGASHYGISDQVALLDSHKFESRYNDSLIGPYPERKDLYIERSPIHFADQIAVPVIFFQGLEDKVVLPEQSEKMVDALRAKHLPVAYLAFAGEQHGFRKAENIKRALDGEFYFYSRILGFTPADAIEPVEIENLA